MCTHAGPLTRRVTEALPCEGDYFNQGVKRYFWNKSYSNGRHRNWKGAKASECSACVRKSWEARVVEP